MAKKKNTTTAPATMDGTTMPATMTDAPAPATMKPDSRPATGRGGKYNFPNAALKRLESDDSKREVIGKALNNILAIYDAAVEPPRNDEELCDRLNWFFETCQRTNQVPTIEKMCLALSWTTNQVKALERGENRGFSPATARIIKKAKNLIASLDAELALDSKIQPVVYMFRAKNYYGMTDVQQVELSAGTTETPPTEAELEAKYKELPPD